MPGLMSFERCQSSYKKHGAKEKLVHKPHDQISIIVKNEKLNIHVLPVNVSNY